MRKNGFVFLLMVFLVVAMMAGCENVSATSGEKDLTSEVSSVVSGAETGEEAESPGGTTMAETSQAETTVVAETISQTATAIVGIGHGDNSLEYYKDLTNRFWVSEDEFDTKGYLEACGATVYIQNDGVIAFVLNGWAAIVDVNIAMRVESDPMSISEPKFIVAQEIRLPGHVRQVYIGEDILSPYLIEKTLMFYVEHNDQDVINESMANQIVVGQTRRGEDVIMRKTLVTELLPNMIYSLKKVSYYKGIYDDFAAQNAPSGWSNFNLKYDPYGIYEGPIIAQDLYSLNAEEGIQMMTIELLDEKFKE